jgi:putative ABC transport system permease protein
MNVLSDLRFAVRSLAKDGRLTGIVILTLALGIGVMTAMFSVIENLLFEPFSYKDFERSAVFYIHDTASDRDRTFTIPQFLAFQEHNHVFEDVIGATQGVHIVYKDGSGNREILGGSGAGSRPDAGGASVTANTFEYFGVPPLLGRGILPQDAKVGAAPVFVMNYRLWQSLFTRDPKVLGSTFILNGTPRTLVGIMPPRFQPYGANVWLPLSPQATNVSADAPITTAMGRLKRGVALASAKADLNVIAHQMSKADPAAFPKQFTVVVETLVDHLIWRLKPTLYLLLGAVFLVLLIACSNVTNLLLARATVRQKEIAIRVSMGASRWALLRQFLTESCMLAVGGCFAGCILAAVILKLLEQVIPTHMVPDGAVIRLNWIVLLFALATSTLATVLCGLTPAFHAMGGDLRSCLAGLSQGSTGGLRHGRFRSSLVMAEVSISIVLLIGTGLMIRTLFALTHVNIGFGTADILYVRLNLPKGRYETAERRRGFFQQVIERVQATPGVAAAAETFSLPPQDQKTSAVTIAGKSNSAGSEAVVDLCSAGYFRALRLRLLRGRLFSEADVNTATRVAVVNQVLARKFFGNQDPIGHKLKINVFDELPESPRNAWFEIIGVISDFKNMGVQGPTAPEALLPYTISPAGVPNLLVSTAEDPKPLANGIFRAIWNVDSDVGISMSGTLEDLVQTYVYQQPKFELATLGAFAAVGLLLVAMGIFSVMAYAVAIRTREIGIRMALGAQQTDILRMVFRKAFSLVGPGIIIGVLISHWLGRLLADRLFGVSVTDPWTFGLAMLVIVAATLAACFLPGRRAAQVDPLIAIRYE